jgi:hypothetical protein
MDADGTKECRFPRLNRRKLLGDAEDIEEQRKNPESHATGPLEADVDVKTRVRDM